jgi:hypothetical protein
MMLNSGVADVIGAAGCAAAIGGCAPSRIRAAKGRARRDVMGGKCPKG